MFTQLIEVRFPFRFSQRRILLSRSVAHGEGKNRTALNEQTKNDIRLHKQDLKIAEEQAIGRKLQNDEWNRMSDQERDQYSKKMLDLVRIRIQDRYRNQRK